MGDTRFKGGFAIGPYANFYARTDNLFAESDATPNVTNGNLFYTNNTSGTTITDFELSSLPGKGAQEFEGKVIEVQFLDGNTTVANAGSVFLTGTDNTFRANSRLGLVYHNSAWYERSRSQVSRNSVQTLNFALSNGTINADDLHTLILVPTVALATFTSISGGYIGQQVTLINGATSAINVQIISGLGNIYLNGTSNFILNQSGAYQVVKAGDDQWNLIRPTA